MRSIATARKKGEKLGFCPGTLKSSGSDSALRGIVVSPHSLSAGSINRFRTQAPPYLRQHVYQHPSQLVYKVCAGSKFPLSWHAQHIVGRRMTRPPLLTHHWHMTRTTVTIIKAQVGYCHPSASFLKPAVLLFPFMLYGRIVASLRSRSLRRHTRRLLTGNISAQLL